MSNEIKRLKNKLNKVKAELAAQVLMNQMGIPRGMPWRPIHNDGITCTLKTSKKRARERNSLTITSKDVDKLSPSQLLKTYNLDEPWQS